MTRFQLLVIYLLILLVSLSGCFRDVKPYEFRQDADKIVSIELRQKEHDSSSFLTPTVLMKKLDESEHQDLIDALKGVSGNYLYTNTVTGIGQYQIWIYYNDGETEIIGAYNSRYILADGSWGLDCYMFDLSEFHELMGRFLEG